MAMLPAEQAAAVTAALPALEELAEIMRAELPGERRARRSRSQFA